MPLRFGYPQLHLDRELGQNVREAAMISRRTMMTAALSIVAGLVSRAARAQPAMSRVTAYAFSFTGLDGESIRLIEDVFPSEPEAES